MKNFPVLGTSIAFTPAAAAYRDSFVEFALLASLVSWDFEDEYSSEKDASECLGLIEEWIGHAIKKTTDAAVADFTSRGVYDIDEVAFSERLRFKLDGSQHWKVLSELLASLPTHEASDQALTPSFIGGGFGAEGALQGIAIATAANLATGLISSGYANAKREGVRRTSGALLKDPATVRRLVGLVHDLVLVGHDVLIEMLIEKTAGEFEFPSEDERRKARAIIRNVANGRVPKDSIAGTLTTALELNPYDPATYVLLRKSGEWNEELDALSAYLGFDLEDEAETAAVIEIVGEQAASQVATLESGIRAILAKYPNNDLHVDPNIPPRKANTASDKYFNMATPPAPESRTEPPIDPGSMIALIDCTLLGSADCGIAFGAKALAWKDTASEPAQISWEEFREARRGMRKTLYGVALAGSELGLSGSKLKRNELIQILNEIGDLLDTRFLPTEPVNEVRLTASKPDQMKDAGVEASKPEPVNEDRFEASKPDPTLWQKLWWNPHAQPPRRR